MLRCCANLKARGGSRPVYKVCTNLSEFFPKIFLRVYIVKCKWFLTLWVQNSHFSNDFFLSASCLRMKWHYCNDLQGFLGLKTALAIIALSFVSLNLHPPRPEMGSCEQFSWTCRSFTENFRWLKPATQTCGWTFSPLFDAISFICEDKSILRRTGSTSLIKFKAKFFSHLLWSSGHRRLKFFWSLWNFLKSINHCWLDPFLRNGYRWIWSSRSKDGVFSSWKWNYWRKFGRNVILSQGETLRSAS